MKLLMLYTTHFSYDPAVKNLDLEPDCSEGETVADAVIGLIHAEPDDELDPKRTEKYLIKNLKWGARKNVTKRIIIHSFSHLSENKASASFTKEILNRAAERLTGAGYEVTQTPFGYFLDLDLKAPGRSTARIFTSF